MSNRPRTRYEILSQERERILALAKTKYLKREVFRDLRMFEDYEKMTGSKMDRYEALADIYNISSRTVRTIITNLKTMVQ